MERRFRKGWIAALLVVLTLSTTACTALDPPIPTDSDVVGTWHHSSATGGPTVAFHKDMTATISGLPESVVTDDINRAGKFSSANPITMSGKWTIGNAEGAKRDALGDPFVQVNFRANRFSTGMNFLVVGTGRDIRLEVQGGDPDDYATYDFQRS
jgi:hypothetical protein